MLIFLIFFISHSKTEEILNSNLLNFGSEYAIKEKYSDIKDKITLSFVIKK